jgi:hypothetical protein
MPTLPISRVTAAALVAGLVLVGCRTLGPEPEPAPAAAATNSVPEEPRIRPLDDSVGRVVSVNVRLKFAVLDYTLYRLPAQGQLLVAERDGAAVGELRVNGPVQGTTLSADVLTGDIRAGDRTRPKR